MRSVFFSLCIVSVLVVGCQTGPSKKALASADYGPYPHNYQTIIGAFVAKIAIDPNPNSTKIRFELPVKGYLPRSSNFRYSYEFGWVVKAWINSKNRFGGYTGDRPWRFLLRNGQIQLMESLDITGYYARPNDW
jgi:hypothetical protein